MSKPIIEILNEDQHVCIGQRQGDWIVFICPICKGYERRVNWDTGEVKVKRGNSKFNHTGSFAPMTSATLPVSNN